MGKLIPFSVLLSVLDGQTVRAIALIQQLPGQKFFDGHVIGVCRLLDAQHARTYSFNNLRFALAVPAACVRWRKFRKIGYVDRIGCVFVVLFILGHRILRFPSVRHAAYSLGVLKGW